MASLQVEQFMDEVFAAIKDVDTDLETKRKFLDKVGIDRDILETFDETIRVTFEIPIQFQWDDDNYFDRDIIIDAVEAPLYDHISFASGYSDNAYNEEVTFGEVRNVEWSRND